MQSFADTYGPEKSLDPEQAREVAETEQVVVEVVFVVRLR